jgi:hypothetical protein
MASTGILSVGLVSRTTPPSPPPNGSRSLEGSRDRAVGGTRVNVSPRAGSYRVIGDVNADHGARPVQIVSRTPPRSRALPGNPKCLGRLAAGRLVTRLSIRDMAKGDDDMATGETGFKDITYDLVSVQYHGLKAGHDYGQYVRDAETAGKKDIADFFRKVMETNSEFAAECHRYLEELSRAGEMGPAAR